MQPNQNINFQVNAQGTMMSAQMPMQMVPNYNQQQPQYYQQQFPQGNNNMMYMPNPNMQMPLLQQQQPQIVSMFQPKMLGFDKLMAIEGVYIKQKFRKLQAILGWAQEHRHFIYALGADRNSKKGSKILKIVERSECCMRQCCTPGCRAFNMEVNHKDYFDPSFDKAPFLKFERNFRWTFFCLNRPEMVVSLVEGGQSVKLGKVVNPWQCCDLKMEVYDANDSLRYIIKGDCCQCGVICQGPCCQEAELAVCEPFGNVVASVKRSKASIWQNLVETVANFVVNFPKDASGPDRALLIAATMMIDYIYFDKHNKGAAAHGNDIGNALSSL